MTPSESALNLFKGRHFDREVIVLCVRWYLSYKLSSRDLVEMMREHGIALAHTTILRWVQRYVPVLESSGVSTRDRLAGHGAVTRPI
jgi:transposase-like protein